MGESSTVGSDWINDTVGAHISRAILSHAYDPLRERQRTLEKADVCVGRTATGAKAFVNARRPTASSHMACWPGLILLAA
jgi:hypothetical protein